MDRAEDYRELAKVPVPDETMPSEPVENVALRADHIPEGARESFVALLAEMAREHSPLD